MTRPKLPCPRHCHVHGAAAIPVLRKGDYRVEIAASAAPPRNDSKSAASAAPPRNDSKSAASAAPPRNDNRPIASRQYFPLRTVIARPAGPRQSRCCEKAIIGLRLPRRLCLLAMTVSLPRRLCLLAMTAKPSRPLTVIARPTGPRQSWTRNQEIVITPLPSHAIRGSCR